MLLQGVPTSSSPPCILPLHHQHHEHNAHPRQHDDCGLAWLIRALRLIRGSRVHRINLIARIHHVIPADLMPLRCMIPMCCQQRYVNGAPLRCNGARTPARAGLAYSQEATACDSVQARGARGRRPRFPGWIRACGWIECTMVHKSHPEAPIHPSPLAVTNHTAHSGITGRRYNTRKRRGAEPRCRCEPRGVGAEPRVPLRAAGRALEQRPVLRRENALRAART